MPPLTIVPSVVERVDCALRLLLPLEARVDVADEVVADVVADVHLEQVAVLGQLGEPVLEEGVELRLDLVVGQSAVRVEVPRVDVDVRDEDRLRVRRLGVLPRTPVAVPAGSDLFVRLERQAEGDKRRAQE